MSSEQNSEFIYLKSDKLGANSPNGLYLLRIAQTRESAPLSYASVQKALCGKSLLTQLNATKESPAFLNAFRWLNAITN